MDAYVNSWWSNEFDNDAVLELGDDGRFCYDEYWHCYAAGGGGQARGIWWQYADTIFFRCDEASGSLSLSWTAGEERKAVRHVDSLDFGGGWTMSLRRDERSETAKNEKAADEAVEKKTPPSVARLHFKDGSVREIKFARDSMIGLFSQTYYRLIDDSGKATNFFAARPRSENDKSTIIEYDEIEITVSDESDDTD